MRIGEEANFNVEITPQAPIGVVIGDNAKMDVVKAVNYIESGKKEIEKAVEDGKADFDDHAADKTQDFDDNAVNKTNAFNQNAVNKTQDFDDNAAIKQAAVDASAAEAKQWAIGDPTEPDGYSSKYWAGQAHAELSDLQSDVAAIQANYVTTNTVQTITQDKTFGNPVTFNNTTTFNTGVSQFYNGGYRMWRYKIASGSTYEDQSYYDSANTFLGSFRVMDTGRAEFISFISVNVPTPTEDSTSSTQIDTVGARNTKLANYVTTNTAQTISESKTFTKAIDGCFNIYGGYNTSTNTNQYKKLATCVISGTYQTRIIPFSYFRNASNAKDPRFDGKLVARVAGTAGTLDTSNSFIVLGEYPNFVGNGAIDFIIAYKNNTPESNQVTVEFWVYVKNTYDGVAIQPFVSASGYSTVNNTQWTWGNPISEASEIPSDFSTIMSEKGTLNTVTQTAGDNSTKVATTAYVDSAVSGGISVPTGVILAFGGSTAPTGFLMCDGSEVSRTDYAALYTVIGDKYGAGDGSTTFNLPNITNCFPSAMGVKGTGNPIGFDTKSVAAPEDTYYSFGGSVNSESAIELKKWSSNSQPEVNGNSVSGTSEYKSDKWVGVTRDSSKSGLTVDFSSATGGSNAIIKY